MHHVHQHLLGGLVIVRFGIYYEILKAPRVIDELLARLHRKLPPSQRELYEELNLVVSSHCVRLALARDALFKCSEQVWRQDYWRLYFQKHLQHTFAFGGRLEVAGHWQG